jgi:hypothetical protein
MDQFFGIYRGIVVSTSDPSNRRRLQVRVPDVLAEEILWAEACVAPGSRANPKTGQIIWVQFERGQATFPVWVGVCP